MQSHLLSTKEGLSKSPKSPTLLKRAIVTTPYSAFSQVIYLAKVTRESPAGSRGLKVPTNKLSLKFEVKV